MKRYKKRKEKEKKTKDIERILNKESKIDKDELNTYT